MNAVVTRPLAIVTGASSGIGLELARECARNGFDLLIAADQPLWAIAQELEAVGAAVETVEADLATPEGVGKLCGRAAGRQVDALMAIAGHGLGGEFLDQSFEEITHIIDTNITGMLALIHLIGRDMRARHTGRILIVGSTKGLQAGTFQAVYDASNAFIDSFSWALRKELKDTGVTVTCLMPGMTDMDSCEAARTGFKAMMTDCDDHAVAAPSSVLAEQHREVAEPGTAKQ